MTLEKKIQSDFQSALKEKKEREVSVLRMLIAAILDREKKKRAKLAGKRDLSGEKLSKESKLTQEEIIEVVFSEIKKRKEAIAAFQKAERKDLIRKEKEELEVLVRYLPRQLTNEEIRDLCQQAIKETQAKGLKDIGKVMKTLMPRIKGRADASQVSKAVKELLSSI